MADLNFPFNAGIGLPAPIDTPGEMTINGVSFGTFQIPPVTSTNTSTPITPAAKAQLKKTQANSVPKEPSPFIDDTTPKPLDSQTKSYSNNFFRVVYGNNTEKKSFLFSLMPAIESHVQLNNPGNKVPEVKPGIKINSKIRQRAIIIPGSAPVYQSVGIEGTTLSLCGLFVGGEYTALDVASVNGSTPDRLSSPAGSGSIQTAYNVAKFFNDKIVLPSRNVTIEINSVGFNIDSLGNAGITESINKDEATGLSNILSNVKKVVKNPDVSLISYTGLISQFTLMAARGDRCYYQIEFSVTKFPNNFQKPLLTKVVTTVLNEGADTPNVKSSAITDFVVNASGPEGSFDPDVRTPVTDEDKVGASGPLKIKVINIYTSNSKSVADLLIDNSNVTVGLNDTIQNSSYYVSELTISTPGKLPVKRLSISNKLTKKPAILLAGSSAPAGLKAVYFEIGSTMVLNRK